MNKFKTFALCALLLTSSVHLPAHAGLKNDSNFDMHRIMKRFMYGALTLQTAFKIFLGEEQPMLPFIVQENPRSIFINFTIPEDKLANLEDHLQLPEGFTFAPIRIIAGETPKYYMSLNIYAVSGLGGALSGNRAEWSVYVKNNGGRTSYMVVEAKSSAFSLDSYNLFTAATPLDHELLPEGLRSFVDTGGETSFESLIPSEAINAATEVMAANEWAAANDLIYWRDGVADRTYYDGQLIDTPMFSITPSALTIADTSEWSEFIDPMPVNVLMFQTGINFAISPWYNLDVE